MVDLLATLFLCVYSIRLLILNYILFFPWGESVCLGS